MQRQLIGFRMQSLCIDKLGISKKCPVDLLEPDGTLIHYDNLFSFEKEYV